MTELEKMQRAKMYLDKLANGIDPISDREMPDDTVLNQVRLSRCLFYVSDILWQVIENGGQIGRGERVHKQPFSVTEVIYALSDFLIMILSWLVKQSLRAFLFQEVQP